LIERFGISSAHIVNAVASLVGAVAAR